MFRIRHLTRYKLSRTNDYELANGIPGQFASIEEAAQHIQTELHGVPAAGVNTFVYSDDNSDSDHMYVIEEAMKIFDLTLKGYTQVWEDEKRFTRAECADADNLIVWVKAPSEEAVRSFLATFKCQDKLDLPIRDMNADPDWSFEDGVDIQINAQGSIVAMAPSYQGRFFLHIWEDRIATVQDHIERRLVESTTSS